VPPATKHLLDETAVDGIRMLGTHILLVDDEQELLDLLTEVLSENGYLVDTAVKVEEAIRLLDNNGYALVISDWLLPDGDGLFVADIAAALGAKTILVSGHLSEMRGGRADAHETMMKPFKLDEFLYAVRGVLGNES
jgi:DNA-binding response OmpR family regulator